MNCWQHWKAKNKPMAENERLHILEMVEKGQITSEEAVSLIQALDAGEVDVLSSSESPEQTLTSPLLRLPGDEPSMQASRESAASDEHPAPEVFAPEPEDLPDEPSLPSGAHRPDRFRKFWLIPLWIGAAITVFGGLLMLLAWQGSGFGFWFACAWFPFLIGVLTLFLAWLTRGTPWLHLRVRQSEGSRPRNIVISFPLPLRLAGWFLRTFRQYIPGLENTNIDEIIVALEHISPETPFTVAVDEGNGEHVEIYIG